MHAHIRMHKHIHMQNTHTQSRRETRKHKHTDTQLFLNNQPYQNIQKKINKCKYTYAHKKKLCILGINLEHYAKMTHNLVKNLILILYLLTRAMM